VDLVAEKERIEELEEELKNSGLAHFLQDRMQTGDGKRLSDADFLAEIGMSEAARRVKRGEVSGRGAP
jgi:hypothetical protein